jgi:murein L,D-transpeptidase YafK
MDRILKCSLAPGSHTGDHLTTINMLLYMHQSFTSLSSVNLRLKRILLEYNFLNGTIPSCQKKIKQRQQQLLVRIQKEDHKLIVMLITREDLMKWTDEYKID